MRKQELIDFIEQNINDSNYLNTLEVITENNTEDESSILLVGCKVDRDITGTKSEVYDTLINFDDDLVGYYNDENVIFQITEYKTIKY